jgi:uroporphyrinogen-III decarboxylase
MFYEMNTNSSKPKTMEEFIRSQYYEGFTKFGRSCIRNEYMDPEKFAEWLIREGKKLQDWNKDKMYNDYLLEFVKKEPGMRALERTITYFATWAEENGADFNQYFRTVSTPRAVHDIRSARVSPWVIHLSESGVELLGRMSNEQVEMIKPLIDTHFWVKVFLKSKEETDEVEAMCTQAGL